MNATKLGQIAMALFVCGMVACRKNSTPNTQLQQPSRSATQLEDHQQSVHSPYLRSVLHKQSIAGSSKYLFERLSPERTGIDFVHTWDPPKKHDREIANAMAGGGVAIGDFDGDGRPDVFLTRPQGGSRLYKNKGEFEFEDVTRKAQIRESNSWGLGATFVDVDNDGDLDLYVCGFACPNRLYINQGDGTFVERAKECGVDFHGASVMMSFADYDCDGDLDGYLLTNRISPSEKFQSKAVLKNGKWEIPEDAREFKDILVKPDGTPFPIDAAQQDHLFRNDGLGENGLPRFVDVTRDAGIAGNEFGLSATWWDFDDDGFPDLYVSNDFYGADHLYRNNGNGTFRDIARFALPHTPWFSMGSDAADINNDGYMDLIASDMSGSNHFKQKVAMGEMEESGWFLTTPTPRQYMRNAVYLNTGTGRFMEIAYLTGLADTNWTWSTNFADFDNDSFVDLFVSNGMTRDWFHSDLRNRARQIGKWNDGGREFWLNLPELKERNFAYKNEGDFQFQDVSKSWGLDHLGVSFGAATADLDGDGDLDLVVNNFRDAAGIFANQSKQSMHRITFQLESKQGNTHGVGATVRLKTGTTKQIRQVWPVHGFMSTSQTIAHFGLGPDSETVDVNIRWPSGRVQDFSNLAAGRHYTITESEVEIDSPAKSALPRLQFARTKTVPLINHQENDFDDFGVQPLLPYRMSALGPGTAWGDVNGDGQDDLFVGGATGQPGTLLVHVEGRLVPQNDFAPGVVSPFSIDKDCEDMGAVWFDIDSDSDLDLYVVSGGYEHPVGSAFLKDRIYLNDHGILSKASVPLLDKLRGSGSSVSVADFDHDGDLDVFLASRVIPGEYPVTPSSFLLRNESTPGHIQFLEVTDELAAGLKHVGLITSSVWADVDNDGWVDLLVASEWGPIRLFHNRQGQLVDATNESGLSKRTGWWNGISGGDLDHDGDIDLVVTNVGLNTKYHASAENPARIFYGDFDGSGTKRIIEAEWEGELQFPVRGRSCSSRALPSLGQKFPTFESFALASLAEIYTPEHLDNATVLSANTLESGVLINDGNGRFDFVPFPRLAQASPAFGAAVGDFDGDFLADIYLAQNFFSPQPETGRMDGGVGQYLTVKYTATTMEFETKMPKETGMILAGDAKSLTTADINVDGRTDLVVASNNGPLLAFENQSKKRFLAVRLLGIDGNVRAVGALVNCDYANGTRLSRHILSSNGYLSQSSAVLSFPSPSNNPIQQICVRWPTGRQTKHRPENPNGLFEIKQPVEN